MSPFVEQCFLRMRAAVRSLEDSERRFGQWVDAAVQAGFLAIPDSTSDLYAALALTCSPDNRSRQKLEVAQVPPWEQVKETTAGDDVDTKTAQTRRSDEARRNQMILQLGQSDPVELIRLWSSAQSDQRRREVLWPGLWRWYGSAAVTSIVHLLRTGPDETLFHMLVPQKRHPKTSWELVCQHLRESLNDLPVDQPEHLRRELFRKLWRILREIEWRAVKKLKPSEAMPGFTLSGTEKQLLRRIYRAHFNADDRFSLFSVIYGGTTSADLAYAFSPHGMPADYRERFTPEAMGDRLQVLWENLFGEWDKPMEPPKSSSL